jgi:hypothetical protein
VLSSNSGRLSLLTDTQVLQLNQRLERFPAAQAEAGVPDCCGHPYFAGFEMF